MFMIFVAAQCAGQALRSALRLRVHELVTPARPLGLGVEARCADHAPSVQHDCLPGFLGLDVETLRGGDHFHSHARLDVLFLFYHCYRPAYCRSRASPEHPAALAPWPESGRPRLIDAESPWSR